MKHLQSHLRILLSKIRLMAYQSGFNQFCILSFMLNRECSAKIDPNREFKYKSIKLEENEVLVEDI
jgi:hypothetical protein